MEAVSVPLRLAGSGQQALRDLVLLPADSDQALASVHLVQ
jgi:hypothetical protein